MDNIVKVREYRVDSHERTMQINIPSLWLREKTKIGDRLGLFQEADTGRLIIDIINTDLPVNQKTQ